jgi:hypothetical protein
VQQAIFHVERAMETMVVEEETASVALCDRGTLDGLAYWPGGIAAACRALGIERDAELSRYSAVIHLRTPSLDRGYNHSNRVRVESAADALAIDARIADAWQGHPRRLFIESEPDFLRKVAAAVAAMRQELPACCRAHPLPELGEHQAVDPCRASMTC